MRQDQFRFHIFAYNDARLISRHFRAKSWPIVLDHLAWLRVNRPDLLTRVKDLDFKPLGKHQRL